MLSLSKEKKKKNGSLGASEISESEEQTSKELQLIE